MTAETWPLLDEAHHALRTAVAGVAGDAWQAPTPCTKWNVSQVLRHAVGDQYAFAGGVTGGPGPDENQFEPSADAPADPTAYADAALAASASAFATVDPDDPAVPTPWPGTMAAALVVSACSLDCMIHAWDIAVATGQPSPLSADYASRLASTASQYVEPLRAFYAPALEPVDRDDAAQALLRYVGRDPAWTPAP